MSVSVCSVYLLSKLSRKTDTNFPSALDARLINKTATDIQDKIPKDELKFLKDTVPSPLEVVLMQDRFPRRGPQWAL